jgi:tRNA modification GTPase
MAKPTGDTIAAIATPPGAGGVGIVRVSGPIAKTIAKSLIGKLPKPRVFHFSTFSDAEGKPLDRGLSVFFAAPHSFTGEDVLELHAHGSPVVLGLILRRVCAEGARMARAGEFSERAFLNGKLDLAQAEAVADLIAAGSEVAARAAMRSLDGEFSAHVRTVHAALVHLRAWLEAALDFPEEEIDFLSAPQLTHELTTLQKQLDDLLAATRRGVVLRDGLHVVIVGRPNAGKSSLLNALAQSERAIVAAIPGTTRDVLRENVQLDGIALTLVDTAGLRESDDPVEREGVRRARSELTQADVVVLMTESASVEDDLALLHGTSPTVVRVVVHSKIDLTNELARVERMANGEIHIWLTAKRGDGLALLRAELMSLAGRGEQTDGAFSARARHVKALEVATQRLHIAGRQLEQRQGELAAEELRLAQRTLSEITGEFTSDDLLGAIFSTFCIGK